LGVNGLGVDNDIKTKLFSFKLTDGSGRDRGPVGLFVIDGDDS
jgi:hypothetical protein